MNRNDIKLVDDMLKVSVGLVIGLSITYSIITFGPRLDKSMVINKIENMLK